MIKTMTDMHRVVFRIIVVVYEPVRLEWILERTHIIPVEPRAGMQIRDNDDKSIWRMPADLILEKRHGQWYWLSETWITHTTDRLEEYLKVMKTVHNYELVTLPKITSKCAEQLEKKLNKVKPEHIKIVTESEKK